MKSNNKTKKQILETFFDFVNADIKSLTEKDFIGLILSYSRFLTHNKVRHDFLTFREKYDCYMDKLLEMSLPETLAERKEFFVELQSHIRSKLQTIIDSVDSDTPKVKVLLVEMKGKRNVYVDPIRDELIDGFFPQEFKSENGLDLNEEKVLADLVFFDFLQDYKLKPKRFGKCLRCKNIFYRTTEKERKYCTKRCSSAARQAKHYQEVIKPEREKGKSKS